MPYRVRSTDVWYNAPGVVAAYQPIGAPDGFAARQNVGNDLRMAGRHTAMPGVAPTWSSAAGWTFGGTQFLNTDLYPVTHWSLIAQFANAAADNGDHVVVGSWTVGTVSFAIWQDSGGESYLMNSNFVATTRITFGSLGLAGQNGYKNGVYDTVLTGSVGTCSTSITLGASSSAGGQKFKGDLLAVLLSTVTFGASHMAQYSRQMEYCHVNPDWNAWGRRRRYYYAPSEVAAGLAFSPVGSGVIGSSVVRSVQ